MPDQRLTREGARGYFRDLDAGCRRHLRRSESVRRGSGQAHQARGLLPPGRARARASGDQESAVRRPPARTAAGLRKFDPTGATTITCISASAVRAARPFASRSRLPPGDDGCGAELTDWIKKITPKKTVEKKAPMPKSDKPVRKKEEITLADLPAECRTVLAAGESKPADRPSRRRRSSRCQGGRQEAGCQEDSGQEIDPYFSARARALLKFERPLLRRPRTATNASESSAS